MSLIRKGSALLLEDSSLHFSSLLSLLTHYSTIWYTFTNSGIISESSLSSLPPSSLHNLLRPCQHHYHNHHCQSHLHFSSVLCLWKCGPTITTIEIITINITQLLVLVAIKLLHIYKIITYL